MSLHQHGFLHGRSVNLQMLECLHAWCSIKNAGSCTDIIYIDMRKAFDHLCHNKLLYKLEMLGINGKLLSWIGNFLSLRTQRVKINNVLSFSTIDIMYIRFGIYVLSVKIALAIMLSKSAKTR